MLEMSEGDKRIMTVRVSGRLTKDEIREFSARFEEAVRVHGPLRLKIHLEDFEGWDWGGFWEDLRSDLTHRSDMERIAIIGERAWQRWGTWLTKPFIKADVRFFEPREAALAESWLLAPAVHA